MARPKINLMVGLLGALAFTATVQAAEPRTAPAADTASATQAEAKQPDASDAYCLRHTGTRIAPRTPARADGSRKARNCSSGMIGRAYTRDDLDRTGEVNIAEALRKLDPAIH